ncbi:hypothetical protein [Paenibacillus maysiensis]|uniref:hypothetical protein n=1 Tax=Paenibacillus maysiensis TaxID=1155954 RepID=UPI000470E7FA|nr:hypothetical protein [Paenibacillus maysiensis]
MTDSTEAIPSGTYVCSYYTGLNHVNCIECLEKLLMYCKKNRWKVLGGAWNIIQVDISLTDQPDEACYEIQILVEQMV